MATLDSFREAAGEPIQLDLANGYIADVRLNSGDVNGRTITVELTDNGTPITTTDGITCALAYNTSPGSDLGDRVTMNAVSGAATATFRAAVPRKALAKPGRILLGIEISSGGNKVCSRNFYGLVERSVFDATSPDADDKLGRIEQLILDADKAIIRINKAVSDARITGGNTTTLDPNQPATSSLRGSGLQRVLDLSIPRGAGVTSAGATTLDPTSPPPPACCRPEARATTRSWSACHAAAGSSAWPRTPSTPPSRRPPACPPTARATGASSSTSRAASGSPA